MQCRTGRVCGTTEKTSAPLFSGLHGTTTENFIATKKVVQELFESEPSRWGTEPDPPEFVRQGWPQFGKSMVLKAASLSAMWGIVKILVSADFSQGDEEVQRTLPTILGCVARHHTDEATDMFDEILLLCQRLPWSTDRLRVWLEETLKLVCESKNVAIFRSLVNHHPDFKAAINATLLSDLLVKALTPPPEHFHRAYEDFIGLPNSELSSISVQQHYLVPTRNKPPETPLGVAEALLPFLRDQIRTGKFKMNAALRYLIQKGCSRDALEWLSFNDLFSKDVVQYPILLFEGILRLRPESTKKGGTVHCPIGYKKLNKHIFTLQAVLTALAQMFHVRDMILALYKVQDSMWPVTLYLLSMISDELGGAIAEYVHNKITVKMLSEAVFVDLSPAATTSTIATNQRDRSDDPMKYVTEGIPAQAVETNTDSSNDTDAAAPTGPHPKSPGHTQPPPTQRWVPHLHLKVILTRTS
ncbi:hypothetical protein Pelo_11789 [Pelomyxa schiedti]|nr:hypothetical protein Pelo_11789 [Pelomyxa schiedti]